MEFREALLTLDALRWRYGANEHALLALHGLFDSLRSIVPWGTKSNNLMVRKLQVGIKYTYKLVSTLVVERAGGSQEDSVVSPPPQSPPGKHPTLMRAGSLVDEGASERVMKQCIGGFIEEIARAEECYRTAAAAPLADGQVSPVSRPRWYTPSAAKEVLASLHRVACGCGKGNLATIAGILSGSRGFEPLLSLLLVGAPPHKIHSAHLIARLAPHIGPDILDAQAKMAFSQCQGATADGSAFRLDALHHAPAVDAEGFPGLDFLKLIASVCVQARLGLAPGHSVDHSAWAVSSELICILRQFLCGSVDRSSYGKSYSEAAVALCGAALREGEVITQEGLATPEALWKYVWAHVCLAILGGEVDGLRVGAPVHRLLSDGSALPATLLDFPGNCIDRFRHKLSSKEEDGAKIPALLTYSGDRASIER